MKNKFDSSLLVETDWLESNLENPNIRIFDCTVWLNPHPKKIYTIVSGKKDYDEGHIPNSDFLNLEDISLKNTPYPFMMPDIKTFDKVMSLKGVGPDTHVILYSRANIQWATRVWWMLKSMGFNNASILNGGYDRWKNQNKNISTTPITYQENKFISIPQNGLFCTKEEVLNSLTNNNISIINALRSTLHDGSEKVDYGRLGHIKNSINIPSLEMVDPDTNLYKSLEDLKIIFKNYNVLSKEKVIAYCGGGIAATNIAFVLTALGFNNITVYDASLSEWAKNNNLPMSVDE
ncbi:MAG: sulfurtransferase [Alphaproteobacteria bacterium]|jgi:thiosulfate/3-mercaptopyruvate sulfurtransferase|tara:strand:- start:1068 stop:1940 length:873 start_codon:yes stop_codon:yes gene_type:complete